MNTHLLNYEDVKDCPMSESAAIAYHAVVNLNNMDLMNLFAALMGEDVKGLAISRTWKSGQTHTEYMTSIPNIRLAQSNQDAENEQLATKNDDYFEERAY
jgi:hypothetical protein